MDQATLLEQVRQGNLAAIRAVCYRAQAGGTAALPEHEFARAVAQSTPFNSRSRPARHVWEFVYWAVVARDHYRNNGGAAAWNLSDPVILTHARWPAARSHFNMCGNGVPLYTDLAVARTLDTSDETRALGAELERWPWRLSVRGDQPPDLEWLAPGDCLMHLPLCVAGSYRVAIRRGTVPVLMGTLLVCPVGPGSFLGTHLGICHALRANFPSAPTDAFGDGTGLVMDLHPDPSAPIRMSGYGDLEPGCPPLRCDAAPHLSIPLHVRMNGVPTELARGAP